MLTSRSGLYEDAFPDTAPFCSTECDFKDVDQETMTSEIIPAIVAAITHAQGLLRVLITLSPLATTDGR